MIKYVSPVLYDEYRLEYMKEMGSNSNSIPPKTHQKSSPGPTAAILHKPSSIQCSKIPELQYIKPVSVLPVFDDVYKYLKSERLIPKDKLNRLFYTDNLQKYLATLIHNHGYDIPDLEEKYPKDARIVIPYVAREKNDSDQRLLGLTCRIVPSGDSRLRYITVKLQEEIPMIYGLDRLNPQKPVYCVEGPLDSLYLPNAVAVGSSGLLKFDSILSPNDHGIDVTYIHDNQPRNKEIVREVSRTINSGNKVCIWEPNSHMKYGKDIGDMIEYGMTPDRVLWEIQRRTFSGIQAQLEFDQWKKI